MIIFVNLIVAYFAHASDLGGVLCRLPKDEGYECGTVGASYSAFYFDADIGDCLEITFKGCGGNQNRFASREDCLNGCRSLTLCGKGLPLMDFAGNIKRCDADRVPCPGSHECIGHGMESVCCLKPERICQASLNAGTSCGGPPQTRYFYDAPSRVCRPFTFTGCGGNENNFKSKGECIHFCNAEIICLRGDPHPDRYSINKIATCTEDNQCQRNYTCTRRADLRKGACCPSRDFVCGSPLAERSNRRFLFKEMTWTFNYRTGDCEMKEYVPGDEQWNSFASQEQCIDFCVGTCPNHLEVHYNPVTGQPQLCDAKAKSGCPMGFECVKTSPFAAICCRTKPICPAAESIALLKEYICCTKPLECPDGMQPLREHGGRPRTCTIGVEGNCPSDYACVLGAGKMPNGEDRHLCCKPQKKCIVPFVDLDEKRPKRCFPGDLSCPSATACLPVIEEDDNSTSVSDAIFFCCHKVDVFTCSDSKMPLLDVTNTKPMRCSRANPLSCPSDYICEELQDGSNACCPNPFSAQVCSEAVTDANNVPITCSGWDDASCSEGSCRRALDGRNYCCRSTVEGGSMYGYRYAKMRSDMLHTAVMWKMLNEAMKINETATRAPHRHRGPVRNTKRFPKSIRKRLPYYLRRLENSKNLIF
ncbi:unnamed protein product [Cylicocyclus nassatus]|uniref:BPTI/Kunitz inhibitor domain-containing protein n=1 Tax=Cylicocyclus nassatus TaxID=53992 RepID=A0AA36GT70_CYLNA|nr:unnamed protein product [Cylicocyclus nassatus]